MADYLNLPCRAEHGDFLVVVEAPRGSIVKLKYDPGKGAFLFERALPLGLAYPYDWGFFPSTLAADGDPLDAMVLWDLPSLPGLVLPCEPLAVLRMSQREGKTGRVSNDRLLLAPARQSAGESFIGPPKLDARLRKQLEQFFQVVVSFTGKDVRFEGWGDQRAARKLVTKHLAQA
jgi:inorganic pyrophosphatase